MVSRLSRTSPVCGAMVTVLLFSSLAPADWKPAEGPLMTRWAKEVSPETVHPEYPRPQMVREDWLNLNGLWDYAIRPKDAGAPQWRGRPALGPRGEGVPPSNRGQDARDTQGQGVPNAQYRVGEPQDALATNAARPASFDGQILVPFPIESALSGVMKPVGPDNRLWYRRTFTVPEKWNLTRDKKRLLLHFGAVDWDATVW
ncbi:MAG: hypothetical protein GTO04_05720, partial [Planctomycetales bacterium]|nr:hypothetical protein [Planctomycetales bacterium]